MLYWAWLWLAVETVLGQDCDGEFSRYLNHDVVGVAQPLVARSTFNVSDCKEECLRADGACQAFLYEQHAFIRSATCRMFRTNLNTAQGHVHLKPKVPNSFPKFHYFELNTTCIALKESGSERLRETGESWGDWSACTVSCGGGSALRARLCAGCPGGQEIERRPCSLDHCASVIGPQREVEGVWSAWGTWTRCRNPCEGSQSRSRSCYVGEVGCRSGAANATESKLVGESERRECKCRDFDFRAISNSFWVGWGRWSSCPGNGCGQGERRRSRQCTVPLACNGTWEQRQACAGRLECKEGGGPVVAIIRVSSTTTSAPPTTTPSLLRRTWTEWRAWSPCSRTCGEGSRIRTRACPSGNCPGRFTQTELCNSGACRVREDRNGLIGESGSWDVWGEWGECSRTCDQGTRSRVRSCRPGRQCFGSSSDVELCGFGICPVVRPTPVLSPWNGWSRWGECSRSCGDGIRTRSRSCSGLNCGEGSSAAAELCVERDCPVWLPWGEWSGCTRTCDSGSRFRLRVCDGLGRCEGESRETEICGPDRCPVELQPRWSEWSEWTECSRSCDSGTRSRRRACDQGQSCPGSALDIRVCSTESCPVAPSSEWSSWAAWGRCSSSCGDATRARARECQGSQDDCRGLATERQLCVLPECETTTEGRAREGGEWGSWGQWALCSTSCGPGIRGRQRRCLTAPCRGDPIVGEACNLVACPLTPSGSVGPTPTLSTFWSAWNEWSSCSESCGNKSNKFRSRFCLRPGQCTQELESQEIPCIRLPDCVVSEDWASWASWSVCSCASGLRSRRRTCSGSDCPGASERQQQVCVNPDCGGPGAVGREEGTAGGLRKGPWLEWGEWTPCSESCGNGIRVRERACDPSAICRGKGFESEFCKDEDCESESSSGDGAGWSSWHAWSECFATFGYFHLLWKVFSQLNPNLCRPGAVEKIRIRVCPEGRWCPGASFQTADCEPLADPPPTTTNTTVSTNTNTTQAPSPSPT